MASGSTVSEGPRQIALKDVKDHRTALTMERDVQIAGKDVANGSNDHPGARNSLRAEKRGRSIVTTERRGHSIVTTERRGHSTVTATSRARTDSRTEILQEGHQESLLEDAKLGIDQIVRSDRSDLGPQGMRLHRSHVGVLTEADLRVTSAVMNPKRKLMHILLQNVPR